MDTEKPKKPDDSPMTTEFTAIYERNEWACGSGPGSCAATTLPYRYFLEQFIEWNAIKTVVDLGCGDWQFSRYINWGEADYLGLDFVASVIDYNREHFASERVEFHHCDITQTDLPAADLIIVKDVLQHWLFEDILRFLDRLSAYRYVLFTNCRTERNSQSGCVLGTFHALDLSLEPFNLPVATTLRWDTKDTQLWLPVCGAIV